MLEEQLNDLGIYALREFARRTGVKSPTSKKKEQLISEILEIREGKMVPQNTKSKQGRPPKNCGYFANVFSNTFSAEAKFQNPVVSLNQNGNVFDKTNVGKSVAGYMEVSPSVASFVWSMVDGKKYAYYMPADLVCKYNLKSGDFVLVNNGLIDGQNVVKEILTINNCPVNKWSAERKDYSNIEYEESNDCLSFDDGEMNALKIKNGESVYLYGEDNKLNTQAAINFVNSCKVDNKIYLNISLAEKNKNILNYLKDVEIFSENITATTEDAKRVVRLAVERVKRLFENGQDVVFVVDDLQSIVGVDGTEMMLAKSIISLTKNSKKGAVTIVVIMPNNNFAVFEKLADKRFKIDGKKLIKF